MASAMPKLLVVVDETKEGSELSLVVGRCKLQDGGDLLCLRLDSFGGESVAEIINLLSSKESSFNMNMEIVLEDNLECSLEAIEMMVEIFLGEEEDVVNEDKDIFKV